MIAKEKLQCLLNLLNEEQREVVAINDDLACVIGNAGSGKTSSLVGRMARMVDDGLDPERILAMTFTRAAASEMNHRLADLGVEGSRVGTIHSVCRQIVAADTDLFVAQHFDTKGKLEIEFKKTVQDTRKRERLHDYDIDMDGIRRYIEACKSTGLCYVDGDPFASNARAEEHVFLTARKWMPVAGVPFKTLGHIYLELERKRGSMGLYDFDDMLLWSWMVLMTNPEARSKWRDRWSHVLVDECFRGDTPIIMSNGKTETIENIVNKQIDWHVVSYDMQCKGLTDSKIIGWHKILNTKPLVSLRLWSHESYAELVCTADQLVLTPAGWAQAGSLNTYESKIMYVRSDGTLIEALAKVDDTRNYTEQYVYDIDVEDTHTFFANGCLVHNCQDSSPIQWDISRLLTGLDSCTKNLGDLPTKPEKDEKSHNLMVIGDSSQSIYGWRSAEPKIFVDFYNHPDVKKVVLPINYRSHQSICDLAVSFVHAKRWHLGGKMKSFSGLHKPDKIQITRYLTSEAEAEDIITKCKEYAIDDGFKSCAILSRLRVGLDLAEISCIRHRIKYIKLSAGSFFDSKEVRDVLAYLRVAACLDPTGSWMLHVINRPFRYIGIAFINKCAEYARERGIHLLDSMDVHMRLLNNSQKAGLTKLKGLLERLNKKAMKAEAEYQKQCAEKENALQEFAMDRAAKPESTDNLKALKTFSDSGIDGPAGMIIDVLRETRYLDELRREQGLATIDESVVSALGALRNMAFLFPTVFTFLTYVDALAIAIAQTRKSGLRLADESREDALILSTIHGFKGREAKHVFLADVTAGTFPHTLAQDYDEELRLLYVAVTRAKEALHVSYIGANEKSKSDFIGLLEKGLNDAKKDSGD